MRHAAFRVAHEREPNLVAFGKQLRLGFRQQRDFRLARGFDEEMGALAGVKLHTLLDLAGNIPAYAWITDAKTSDMKILDLLHPEPGSIYVLDRGYIDFGRLRSLSEARVTFVVRAKKNLRFDRVYSRPADRSIKQHLRIKAFYGTSPNVVRTQIWIAISVYVLVAIVRKRLG